MNSKCRNAKSLFTLGAYLKKVASAILTDVESCLPAQRNGVATEKATVKSEFFAVRAPFPGGRMPSSTAGKDARRHIFRQPQRLLAGRSRQAFTLIEFWVVITVLSILSCILLPALSQSRLNSKSFQCLENARRLTMAWQLYAGDNRDSFVVSSDDSYGTAPYQTTVATNKNPGNNYAWTWSKMNFDVNNPYNWDTNADIILRPRWQYVNDATIYKCPADPSQITIGSLPPVYAGPYTVGSVVPRIRSYSMNHFLGGLGGMNGDESWSRHFLVYLKLSEIGNLRISPGPGQTFVFIDEQRFRRLFSFVSVAALFPTG